MLLADLLDLFIAQHAAGLSNFVLIFLLGRSCVLTLTFLLYLEGGLSGPVLSERIIVRIVHIKTLRAFIRLSLMELVTVRKGCLPLLGVLATSEATHTRDFAYLGVDLVDVCVFLKLLHRSDEGHFTHHNGFLE
jgi:hypothetical protein